MLKVRSFSEEKGKLRQTVLMGSRQVYADAGLTEGGEDRGVAPLDMISGALAACTAMTMRGFARRRGWPIQSLDVWVEVLPGNGDGDSGFHRQIALDTNLSDSQERQILDAADDSVVYQTLLQHHEVRTERVNLKC